MEMVTRLVLMGGDLMEMGEDELDGGRGQESGYRNVVFLNTDPEPTFQSGHDAEDDRTVRIDGLKTQSR